MKVCRTMLASMLALTMAAPVFAQSAAQPLSAPPTQPAKPRRAMVYTGAAVFGAGLGTALYGFIRVGNGAHATFGEATARNKPLGAAGMAAAFGGGALMFLGTRTKYAPSAVTITRERVSVTRTVSW